MSGDVGMAAHFVPACRGGGRSGAYGLTEAPRGCHSLGSTKEREAYVGGAEQEAGSHVPFW